MLTHASMGYKIINNYQKYARMHTRTHTVYARVPHTITLQKVIVSIGYKGVPLPELDNESTFDFRSGTIRNNRGRVCGLDDDENHKKGNINVGDDDNDNGGSARLYVAGWLKRGPTGIIGTNITDAKDTVASMMEDIHDGKITISDDDDRNESGIVRGRKGLDSLLERRGQGDSSIVDWKGLCIIDEYERKRSRLRSDIQPREKITSVKEAVDILQR